ncbi:unnamed protein product [Peronospora destructor]|uniref:Uncharacterized protein n=1 Tax=Peronospora destructor TaxID=86335 RepID=A0AAV0TSQ3_9STRA|nr:unnamed protein product [Peronospora destructor]
MAEGVDTVPSVRLEHAFSMGLKFVVESLTDLTVYMAYYTIAHHLQANLDGPKLSSHDIKSEQMTKEVFACIYLKASPPTESTILLAMLKQIRDECE